MKRPLYSRIYTRSQRIFLKYLDICVIDPIARIRQARMLEKISAGAFGTVGNLGVTDTTPTRKNVSHVVVIRFSYPPDADADELEWRFAYFREHVLPSLLSQTNKDFTIAIRTNGSYEWNKRFEDLSKRIITFTVDPGYDDWMPDGYTAEEYAKKKTTHHVDFTPWESVIGLPQFDIQTSLDSDDILLRDDFIDMVESMFLMKPDLSAHLHVQPLMYNVPDKTLYTCTLYRRRIHSPIYSIYQPVGTDEYFFVGHDSHLRMNRYMSRSIYIVNPGWCAMSVHDLNMSTYLFKGAKKV